MPVALIVLISMVLTLFLIVGIVGLIFLFKCNSALDYVLQVSEQSASIINQLAARQMGEEMEEEGSIGL